MNLMSFARNELKLLESSLRDKDDNIEMQKQISKDILAVLEVVANQGHSVVTAQYIFMIIRYLCQYKPLTPLTGEDSEWDINDSILWQNKRCPAVFKDGKDGKAYYANGYMYQEPNNDSWFTCTESRRYITFPCEPKQLYTEYRKLKYLVNEVPIEKQIKDGSYIIV